ncbi:hypothetical protein, partial [Pantoea agglomerans]|uniref:hypothetical protein n=1 Tax=Enterobacter agglomerans TaxID=549 RepID=UPI003D1A51CA
NYSEKALNIKAEITAGELNAILLTEPKVIGNFQTHSDSEPNIKRKDNSEGVGRPSEPLSG